ncbi:MAG: DUF4160 domain-containing protein [Acidimicrobiales bacterium]
MPRISGLYGITTLLYYSDHAPPHFHARYGEYEAQVLVATGEVLAGTLPRRAQHLGAEWAALHRDELWAKLGKGRLASILGSM